MKPTPSTPDAAGSATDAALQQRCLRAMREALAELVVPELQTPRAITTAHMALRLLDHLAAAQGRALCASRPLEHEGALQRAWAALHGTGDVRFDDDTAFAQLAATAVMQDTDAARSFLGRLAEAQLASLVRLDPAAARGVADMYLGGRKAEEDESRKAPPVELLTAESLNAYLHVRFPERTSLQVHSLTILPGGMSKQTIRVGAEEHGRPWPFILRKDLAINPADRTVVEEFPLLQFVWRAGGVPMPEPLWLEADPKWFGTPLMACGLVEGSNEVTAWASDPESKHRFTESLAAALSRLHSIAPPGSESRTTREHAAREIDRWYVDFKRWELEPRPLMEAAFAWLRSSIPQSARAPSLVHGDVGFHNMLSANGEVTGLLDWEFSHVGDAAADLVYARPFIEVVLDWPSFLAAYERHGGIAPTPEEERFWAAWGSARNAAGCAGALNKFLHHPAADMRLAVSGMTFLARFELDAFERALGNRGHTP